MRGLSVPDTTLRATGLVPGFTRGRGHGRAGGDAVVELWGFQHPRRWELFDGRGFAPGVIRSRECFCGVNWNQYRHRPAVSGENDPVPAVGDPIDQISELRPGFGDGEFMRGHVRIIHNVQNRRKSACNSPLTCNAIRVPSKCLVGGRQYSACDRQVALASPDGGRGVGTTRPVQPSRAALRTAPAWSTSSRNPSWPNAEVITVHSPAPGTSRAISRCSATG